MSRSVFPPREPIEAGTQAQPRLLAGVPRVRGMRIAALALLASGLSCSGPEADGNAVAAAGSAVTETSEAVPAAAAAIGDAADAVAAQVALADRTREIIRPTCGSCHTTSSPQAQPKALAIYDLDRPDWGTTMSRKRLAKFSGRIAAKPNFSAAERVTLDEYVQALLARAPD
jgi:mono/diheme cytochrome c family protein